MRLTKRFIDAAVYEGKSDNARDVRWDDDLRGFGLRIFPSGKKSFVLSYRAHGKKRLLTVGAYGALTLDQARKHARVELGKVQTQGADPVEARRQRTEETATLATFGDLLSEYVETLKNANTAKDARLSFQKNVPALLRGKYAKDVTGADIDRALDRVRARGAGAVESNLYRFLHAVFELAMSDGAHRRRYRVESNPVGDAKKPKPRPPGNRELSAEEIGKLWSRLDGASMTPETVTIFKLLLLTGQRVEEILGAKWVEVDFERRILDIPAERLKTGEKTHRGHVVPLGDMALELFAAVPATGAFVFPKKGDPESSMPFRSISQAAARLCGDPVSRFPKFTPRDIRRTVKTRLSEIGVLKEIRDRVQNHALHDVASKHYDRFDHLPAKRAALLGWEWELRRILAGRSVTDEWKKWLRRFVNEPDNDLPGRKLRRLMEMGSREDVVDLLKQANA